jgi:hypothetical protein
MRITTSLLAIMLSAVLSGCGSQPTLGTGRMAPLAAATQKCPKGNCVVVIAIDPSKITADNSCGVDVPATVVNLGGPGGGPKRLIVWAIDTDGYAFSTASGIPALNPKGSTNFATPVVRGPWMSDLFTVSMQGLSHEYGLNIVKPDGTACTQYDPWVIE